jgi:hypothetical protein
VKDKHIGEHLAIKIMEVVKDYRIALKLGYFIIDNTSNNDIMIIEISLRK